MASVLLWSFLFVCLFGHKVCEILAPQIRIEPAPPAWEGITTGPP